MFMIGLVTLPTGLLGAPGTSDRCDWAIKIFSPDGENLLPHVAAAYREVTSMMDRGRAKLMRQLDTTHCGNNSAQTWVLIPPPIPLRARSMKLPTGISLGRGSMMMTCTYASAPTLLLSK
jgi:hypothetical protein